MARTTIDLGIDLGTTNSACAVFTGDGASVVRNNDNHECTPSSVWLRGPDRPPVVGHSAYQRAAESPEDVASTVKLLMGTAQKVSFQRAGVSMLPEEVSAEILKSLRGDAQQRTGEEFPEAVITVPAAFTLPQREATKRAAELAGFQQCMLLQEPVAAGLAYGFNAGTGRQTWLVYDLGGGTFDAAILRAEDGDLRVLEHGGDEHLGGGKLDRLIADELVIPALLAEYRLKNFRRDPQKPSRAFALITREVERAKIRLSRKHQDDITLEFEHEGEDVFFEYSLERADVERLADGIIADTIRTCKRVMGQARLGRHDIQSLLLVGGPTLMPYIRERLADPTEGLGIPFAPELDPMTVVARGAALHAGSIALERPISVPVTAGTCRLTWECYEPVGASNRPSVAGRIEAPADLPLRGAAVEITRDNAARPWRSRFLVAGDGRFEAELFAEAGAPNRYRVTLIDQHQVARAVAPDEFTYAIGMVSNTQRANLPIGIAMADHRVDVVVERGTQLPCEELVVHELAVRVPARGSVDVLIPLVEGEDRLRADRNRQIGAIRLAGKLVPRDLAVGTEVTISVRIDESGTLSANATIAGIPGSIPCENAAVVTVVSPRELQTALSAERTRADEFREQVIGTPAWTTSREHITRAEELTEEVDAMLRSGSRDPAIRLEAENRLMILRRTLDEAARAAAWPLAEQKAQETREKAENIVYPKGTYDEEEEFELLRDELEEAIGADDLVEVERVTEELDQLHFNIWWRQPDTLIWALSWLEGRRSEMSHPQLADMYVQIGETAIRTNDMAMLIRAINDLFSLLPSQSRQEALTPGAAIVGVTQRKGT